MYTSGTIRKAGGRGSCLAEEGEVPYMKGQLYDLFALQWIITTSEILIPEVQKSGGLKPPPPLSILSLT